MNKAVSGVFSDTNSASRAINDLKASGFGGDNISELIRDQAFLSDVRRAHSVWPAMEVPKGIVAGAITGAVVGFLLQTYWGMDLAIAGFDYPASLTAVATFGIVGGVAGLIAGLAAMLALAKARRTLLRHLRPDVVVTVQTDEAHAQQAVDLFRHAGALDVRRGAASMTEEFRAAELVRPEPVEVDAGPSVVHEPVQTPEGVTLP